MLPTIPIFPSNDFLPQSAPVQTGGAADGGFAGLLGRMMTSAGNAADTPRADGFIWGQGAAAGAALKGKGTFFEKNVTVKNAADSKDVIRGILDTVRDAMRNRFGGEKGIVADREALDALSLLMMGSGLSPEKLDGLLAKIDTYRKNGAPFDELLEELDALIAENGGLTGNDGAEDGAALGLLPMGMVPFLQVSLEDAGIPADRVDALLAEVKVEGKGISLPKLAQALTKLRQDLTDGSVAPDKSRGSRDQALLLTDRLLTEVRGLEKDGEGFRMEKTAADLLRNAVVSGLKEKTEDIPPDTATAAYRMRLDQGLGNALSGHMPGSDPKGVTEAMDNGVLAGVSAEGRLRSPGAVGTKKNAGQTRVAEKNITDSEASESEGKLPFSKAKAAAKAAQDLMKQKPSRPEAAQTDAADIGDGFQEARNAAGDKDVLPAFRVGADAGDPIDGDPARDAETRDGDRLDGVAPAVKRDTGFVGETKPVRPAPPAPPAYAMRQVSRKLQLAVQKGQNEVSFQLKPEALGRMHMRIESVANGVNVRILAEKNSTQEMLAVQASELKAQMQDQGIRVERIEVSVPFDFDSALNRERGRDSGHSRDRRGQRFAMGGIGTRKGEEGVMMTAPVRDNRTGELNLIA